MKKLGQKGASTVTLALQDCRIPVSSAHGRGGEAVTPCFSDRWSGRASARRRRDSGSRRAPSTPWSSWASERDLLSSRASSAQDLQFELARLRGEITAARAMLLSVCDEVDFSPEEPVAEVSLVKMHCTTLGTRVAADLRRVARA